jgi:hypothetical protein
MSELHKRDISISMRKANLYGIFLAIPVAVLQVACFSRIHGIPAFEPELNLALLVFLILAGIPAHELIHGHAWAIFGKKRFSSIKFGFMWKTMTPYAHVTEPLEVNAYRLGAFMPGLALGIIPFIIAMATGNGDLLWFSLLHTTAASGDWLILWLIRAIQPGSLVEDHPTKAGCYVLENA